MHERSGTRGVALGGGAGHAVLQMFVEQLQPDALQCLADGRHLGEYVDAVRVVVDHSLDAAHLTLDASQPGEQRLLVVAVTRVAVHADSVPPWGINSHRVTTV